MRPGPSAFFPVAPSITVPGDLAAHRDRATMNQVWLGIVIAGAAGVAGLILRRLLSGSAGHAIDAGVVSESWLSEQRAGKREDRYP